MCLVGLNKERSNFPNRQSQEYNENKYTQLYNSYPGKLYGFSTTKFSKQAITKEISKINFWNFSVIIWFYCSKKSTTENGMVQWKPKAERTCVHTYLAKVACRIMWSWVSKIPQKSLAVWYICKIFFWRRRNFVERKMSKKLSKNLLSLMAPRTSKLAWNELFSLFD